MSFEDFECDKCGACCKHLIVEAYYYDVMREPKLHDVDMHGFTIDEMREDDRVIVLYDTKAHQCPFLSADNQCSIYPTRPVCCVVVEAGDAKCQQSRKLDGLPMLRDKNGKRPTWRAMKKSCMSYVLDTKEVWQEEDEE